MGKNRKQPRNTHLQGPTAGKSYYRLFLYAVVSSWGLVAPLNASVSTLKKVITDGLLKLSVEQGQFNMDPEIPDSEIAVLLPALASRGIGQADILNIVQAARTGGTALVDSDGQITMGGAAATGDSWQENTNDWWNSTWGLNGQDADWAEGWNQFCQGWDDFWAGNF